MLYGAFSTTCDRIQGEWGEGGEEEIENGMDFFCFFSLSAIMVLNYYMRLRNGKTLRVN